MNPQARDETLPSTYEEQVAEAVKIFGKELFEAECEWEISLRAENRARISNKLNNAVAMGRAHNTPGGRSVLFRVLGSVEKGVEEYLAEGTPTDPRLVGELNQVRARKGRPPSTKTRDYLRPVGAPALALIAVRNIIRAAGRGSADGGFDQGDVVNEIVAAIEVALDFTDLSGKAPNLLRFVERDNRKEGYSHHRRKRRLAKTAADVVGKRTVDQRDRRQAALELLGVALTTSAPRLVTQERFTQKEGNSFRTTVVYLPNPSLMELMTDKNARFAMYSPAKLPFMIPARRAHDPEMSPLWSAPTLRRSIVPRATGEHLELLREATASGALDAVYRARSLIECTGMRINKAMFETALQVRAHLANDPKSAGRGLLPSEELPKVPAKPSRGANAAEVQYYKDTARAAYRAHSDEAGRRFQVHEIMATAERLISQRLPSGGSMGFTRLHFTYSCDHRGRFNCDQSGLSWHGNRFARSMLQFAEGKPIGPTGERALMIEVANRCGLDKLSFDERVAWTRNNSEMLYRIAKFPIREIGEWARFGNKEKFEPWEALSGILEWADYLDAGGRCDGSFISHLPCQIDGTCNGMQHLAGLSGNRELAELVNVTSTDGGARQDLYQTVADDARRNLRTQAERGGDAFELPSFETPVHGLIGDILQLELADRSMAKVIVMPLPYGAEDFSTRPQILAAVEDRTRNAESQRRVPWLAALHAGSRSAEARAARKRLDALSVVLHDFIRDAANLRAEPAKRYMGELKSVARTLSAMDMPIQFTSPSGFPVYIRERKRVDAGGLDARINGERFRGRHTAETDELDKAAQVRVIAPNFVHSMEAAHMVISLCLAADSGVTSMAVVHDSFATHAEDIDKLRQALEAGFRDVYGARPAWTFDMQLLAQLRMKFGEDAGFGRNGWGAADKAETLLPPLSLPCDLDVSRDTLGKYAFS